MIHSEKQLIREVIATLIPAGDENKFAGGHDGDYYTSAWRETSQLRVIMGCLG